MQTYVTTNIYISMVCSCSPSMWSELNVLEVLNYALALIFVSTTAYICGYTHITKWECPLAIVVIT